LFCSRGLVFSMSRSTLGLRLGLVSSTFFCLLPFPLTERRLFGWYELAPCTRSIIRCLVAPVAGTASFSQFLTSSLRTQGFLPEICSLRLLSRFPSLDFLSFSLGLPPIRRIFLASPPTVRCAATLGKCHSPEHHSLSFKSFFFLRQILVYPRYTPTIFPPPHPPPIYFRLPPFLCRFLRESGIPSFPTRLLIVF